MNRFRFRLDNVLRLRGINEDKKKHTFGEAVRHLKKEEDKLGELDESLKEHEKLMEERGKGNISAKELKNNSQFARAVEDKISNQNKIIDENKEIVEGKRAELAEATKQKKVIERLKDRHREEYDKAADKEEQKVIDELTSQRFDNNRQ